MNNTILASEIVVLGRAYSIFYAAKLKKVKNTGDLTYSLKNRALNINILQELRQFIDKLSRKVDKSPH